MTDRQTDRQANKLSRFLMKNHYVLRNSEKICLSDLERVNLNAWITPNSDVQNIGDYLSIEVVKYVCAQHGIDFNKTVSEPKHLYAIGSVLLGYQDATIWGAGFGFDSMKVWLRKVDGFIHRHRHHLDVRAVRGPETRRILTEMGYECPPIYGNPAILTPKIYEGKSEPPSRYIVIPHYSKIEKYQTFDNAICTFSRDWKRIVDRIVNTELVISSSLHGIILAEAYGIPAVMLNDTPSDDITKHKDWYYATGRTSFQIADSVGDALKMQNTLLPAAKVKEMQERLLNTFPYDLWND